MNSIPAKDTIYVDVDDEITTIIDKVRVSQSKIVALVLPKRATTLQSIVNMKLLKHCADQEKKHLVLITSEAGLLPLAANIGLYVAKNLQSKPEIPDFPHGAQAAVDELDDLEETMSLDDAPTPAEPKISRHAPIGDLAKGSMSPTAVEDTIDFDNDAPAIAGAHAVVDGAKNAVVNGKEAKAAKPKRDKKLSIPNFNKFRVLLIVGGSALVLLIVVGWLCLSVLPKASILVETNSTAINTNVDVVLNPSVNTVSANTGTVPAGTQQVQKTLTGQAASTGQQNNGTKASGSVSLSAGACTGNQPSGLASGTGLSSGGQTYILQEDVGFSAALSKGKCTWQGQDGSGSSNIAIAAQSAGASANTSGSASFSVVGRSDVSATGSATGGTDNITKIVAQADIDSAKSKIAAQDTTSIKQQLQTQLTNAGYDPIAATFNAGTPTVTTSNNAGDTADSVTVTEAVSYTMLGAKKTDLQQLIANSVKDQIDTSKQTITDYGIDQATFKLVNQSANGSGTVAMQATAVAGPDLNVASLKKQVAGMKTGDVKTTLKTNPGVTDVSVTYSPFWVSAVPKNTSKITLVIDKPQKTTNATAQ